MAAVGDGGEVDAQPPLERAELLVDGGEHAADHQEVAQVGGGPPGLKAVECLMGQLYLSPAEAPQQVVGGPGAALARV